MFDQASLAAFLLVLARLSGVFLIIPFFGHRSIPVLVKVSLVLVLALCFSRIIEMPPEACLIDIVFVLRIAFEMLIGLFLGYLFLAVFMALTMAGQIIDFEMGFGLAQVFDPSIGSAHSVLSNFYSFLGLLVFIICGGHRLTMVAVAASYRAFPAGSLTVPSVLSPVVVDSLSDILLTALKVGAPVIGALFVADVVFGIVARAVPQMNVFVIGFPLKSLLGLLAISITLPFTVTFIQDLFIGLERALFFRG